MHQDMNKDFIDFKEFAESNLNADGSLPAFLGEWAESFINEENVEDIIKYLGISKGTANEVFWHRMNNAPKTDEEWSQIMYIGSGVSQDKEHQDQLRERTRKVVELVRNTKYYQKYMVELFGQKNA